MPLLNLISLKNWKKTEVKPISSNNDNKNELNTNKNGNLLLMIKGIEKEEFKNGAEFKIKLCQSFSGVKISKLYRKNNGIINVFCSDENSALKIKKDWSNSPFKNHSVIDLQSHIDKNTKYWVIMKQVPKDLEEDFLVNDIKKTLPSLEEVVRFTKNNKKMHSVKLNFADKTDFKKVIDNGLLINDVYYSCEEYKFSKVPKRCYNCFEINHNTSECKNKTCCPYSKNCNNEHGKDSNCEFKSKPTCVNCKGHHPSFSKDCPQYISKFTSLNEPSKWQTKVSSVNVAYLNICSFYNKIFDIKNIIKESNLKIFFLVESWLHNNITDNEILYYFPDFKIIRLDRAPDKQGGGILILYHNSITITNESNFPSEDIEILHVSISYKLK